MLIERVKKDELLGILNKKTFYFILVNQFNDVIFTLRKIRKKLFSFPLK
jgi:hypothetical protein